MLTERLQNAGLRGLGSVLSGPPGPEEGYEASRLRVAPGGMPVLGFK